MLYLLDIVIAQSPSILKLFACEDQTLLIGWNAFFVLDLGLDVVDCIAGFDFEGDGFAREGLDEAVCFDATPSVFPNASDDIRCGWVLWGGGDVSVWMGRGNLHLHWRLAIDVSSYRILWYRGLDEEPTLAGFVAPSSCNWRCLGLCKYCVSILDVGLR